MLTCCWISSNGAENIMHQRKFQTRLRELAMAMYPEHGPCIPEHGHVSPNMAMYPRTWPCIPVHGHVNPNMAMYPVNPNMAITVRGFQSMHCEVENSILHGIYAVLILVWKRSSWTLLSNAPESTGTTDHRCAQSLTGNTRHLEALDEINEYFVWG